MTLTEMIEKKDLADKLANMEELESENIALKDELNEIRQFILDRLDKTPNHLDLHSTQDLVVRLENQINAFWQEEK